MIPRASVPFDRYIPLHAGNIAQELQFCTTQLPNHNLALIKLAQIQAPQ